MKSKLYVLIMWTSLLCTSRVYGDMTCPDLENYTGTGDAFPHGWELSGTKNPQIQFQDLVFQGAWIFDVRSNKPAECHYAYQNNRSTTKIRLINRDIHSVPEGPSYSFLGPANVDYSPEGAHCRGTNINACRYALLVPPEKGPEETTQPVRPPSVEQPQDPKPSKPPAMAPIRPAPPPMVPVVPVPAPPPPMAPITPAPAPMAPVTPAPVPPSPPMESVPPAPEPAPPPTAPVAPAPEPTPPPPIAPVAPAPAPPPPPTEPVSPAQP